ncbi:MAG: response regulator transcription factor [Acidobacteria bacterium]|nr:response regulator transcription factor [Acidobacteriota bacterium]MBS1864983.1 response regulator transcription factor [Acidobacteriota bacterium]
MKVIRRTQSISSLVAAQPSKLHQTFLFCEKQSGAAHFQVNADSSGNLPLEQAACLLAMHCMVRGQSPEDYVVMAEVESSFTMGLQEKAQQLLQAGQAVKSEIKVTRREEEVLRGILRGHANKEIAGNLNLSERTVKFHVSSLLSKFRVRGRMELVREASRFSNWAPPQKPVISVPAPREIHPLPARAQRVAHSHPVFAVTNAKPAVGGKLQLSV